MALIAHTAGRELSRFIDLVKSEYWQRSAFDDYADGMRQVNTSRVVTCQLLEGLSELRRATVVADLGLLNDPQLLRDPAEFLNAATTPSEILFDLVCECCWQELMRDLGIRVEDEIRSALAEA